MACGILPPRPSNNCRQSPIFTYPVHRLPSDGAARVDLEAGLATGSWEPKNDFVHLTYNAGAHLHEDVLLLVLSLRL